MPELPEVQTIVSQLAPRLGGAVIESVAAHPDKVFRTGLRELRTGLPGRKVDRVLREGKRIIVLLSPPARLVVHLGMTGRLVFRSCGEAEDKHTHLRLRFIDRPWEVRFVDPRKFGGVWFLRPKQEKSLSSLRELGPDALTIRAPVLREIARRRRQIKALLLDQQVIGGLGNIYTDEALFAARIHPLTRGCDLSEQQVRSLARAIRKTLRSSIASGGTTMSDYRDANGSEGAFWRRLRVYGREGEPCGRCATEIRRLVVAGRSTHVCPRCQSMKIGRPRPGERRAARGNRRRARSQVDPHPAPPPP